MDKTDDAIVQAVSEDTCEHPLLVRTVLESYAKLQAESSDVEGPAHSCPKPADGLAFDERGVLVPVVSAQQAESVGDERAAFELPALPEALEIEWPALNAHALGCGVEDRGLHDRYDCANYGFEDGVDKAASCVPNEIYDADQMREYAQAAVAAWQARAAQSGQRAGVAIPEGWQLVPKTPTREMCQAAAGIYAIHATDDLYLHKAGWSMHAIMNGKRWVDMLAAAPTPAAK